MKNRNLLSIKKLAVLGICVSFVAGGCGKMTESRIPKLEEPVALNEAYRPVEYGTIGSMQVRLLQFRGITAITTVPMSIFHRYMWSREIQ